MKIETLQDLYARELQDLYGSERMLVKWLAKMAESADSIDLRQALQSDAEEARTQLTRIEKIFQGHGEKPVARQGKSLEGIIRESEEDMAEAGNPQMRDAMIVAAVQQAKHYEIAVYGTLQAYAMHLGHTQAARMLQSTLQEERAADRKLSEISLHYMRTEVVRS